MGFTFVPEYYFEAFDWASADFLLKIGVKGIVLDVDNTLEPYENPLPSDRVISWINSLREAGISAAIVSNNGHMRIDLFNKVLGLPTYCNAAKPFKKNVCRAMVDMGTDKENTILMGDQIFTDVWAAHNAKIRAILVPPIRDKRDILTRFKRICEKPVLKRYGKIHNEKEKKR